MFIDGKLIESKRYPPDLEEELLPDEPGDAEAEVDSMAFWLEAEKESVYLPIPGKAKFCRCFIEKAMDLSRRWEIDMDIWEKPHCTEISLYLRSFSAEGGWGRELSELIALCDRVCFFRPGTRAVGR